MRSEWNGPNRVVAHRYSVVYDDRTGQILHVHESRAIEGAEIPDDAKLEQRAIELAGRLSKDRFDGAKRHLSVLTLDAAEVNQDVRMKVDVKKRELVTVPARAPRKEAATKPASRRARGKADRKLKRSKRR
jgi:hypothetical protein